jgi:hypothetical protein
VNDRTRSLREKGARPKTGQETHCPVRSGRLYYVKDPASARGWSVVEVEGADTQHRAAFVPGQLEAVSLEEIRGEILGPVPTPR